MKSCGFSYIMNTENIMIRGTTIMWKFIKEYSYDAVKMLVTQCAISLFGLVLVLAAGLAENDTLSLLSSIGASLFYLFLLYTTVWEMGAKDSISVEYGHRLAMPLKGLYISAMANAINFVLAIGILLGLLLADVSFFSTLGGICKAIDVFIQSMYAGILKLQIAPGTPLNSLAFVYFLTPLPAMGISCLGYWLGTKNIRILGPLSAPANQKKNPKDRR